MDLKKADDDEAVPPRKELKYPCAVFFIIVNEFCERFCFYGLRAILVLYLNNILLLNEDDSTLLFHTFTMLCYFFPLVGGVIADSWLGKFRTILYLSLLYTVGCVLLSLASWTSLGLSPLAFSCVGLALIAMGTGGIKPCVATFGGEQFTLPEQAMQLGRFFSIFYICINVGALVSTFATPELRVLPCLGADTCYPAAFGLPAALMLAFCVVFVAGKPLYVMKKPQGAMLLKVSQCIWSALRNRMRCNKRELTNSAEDPDPDWLDYADQKYDAQLRTDIRALLRLLLIFVPLPVFFALFDQQGSRWTFQATNMDGRLGDFELKPDQMQLSAMLFMIATTPVLDTLVHPALARRGLLTTPLQKMGLGCVMVTGAFLLSGALELQVQKDYVLEPSPGLAQTRVFSLLPCDVTLQADDGGEQVALESFGVWAEERIECVGRKLIQMNVLGDCASGKIQLTVIGASATSFALYADAGSLKMLGPYEKDNLKKATNAYLKVIHRFSDGQRHLVTITSEGQVVESVYLNGTSVYVAQTLPPNKYSVALDGAKVISGVELGTGGVYTMLITESEARVVTIVGASTVHMLWQLPQFFLMALADIWFLIPALHFGFTEAAENMKSVVNSAFLLTTAFGDLIIIFVTGARLFDNRATELFVYAALMTCVTVLFIFMTTRYTYIDTSSFLPQDADEKEIKRVIEKLPNDAKQLDSFQNKI